MADFNYSKLYRDTPPVVEELPPGFIAVPQLIGLHVQQALDEIEARGFMVHVWPVGSSATTPTNDPLPGVAHQHGRMPLEATDSPPALIVEQNPVAGTPVAPGSVIHVRWGYPRRTRKPFLAVVTLCVIVVAFAGFLTGWLSRTPQPSPQPQPSLSGSVAPTLLVDPSEVPSPGGGGKETIKVKVRKTVTVTATPPAPTAAAVTPTVTVTVTAEPTDPSPESS